MPVLFPALGIPLPEQTISGNRVIELTRNYVVAFAELHLRNHPEPLLDGPSAWYPEVTFEQAQIQSMPRAAATDRMSARRCESSSQSFTGKKRECTPSRGT